MSLPAFVCLSVCLLARLLKTRAWIWMKCSSCVSTDVGTWTNLFTSKPDPDYSRDAGTAATRNFITSGKYHAYVLGARRCSDAWFKMVLFTASRGTTLSEVHALHRVRY